jgi:hypothetical protein
VPERKILGVEGKTGISGKNVKAAKWKEISTWKSLAHHTAMWLAAYRHEQ